MKLLVLTLARSGFDKRRYGTMAMGKPPVRTARVHAVAFVFRFLECAGINDAAACPVGFQCPGEGRFCRQAENGLKHLDHVIEGMLVVVKDNDVVEPFLPGDDVLVNEGFDHCGSFRHVLKSTIEIGLDRMKT
jgi:hypothetical protein